MDMQEFILFKLWQPAPIAFHVEQTDGVRRNEWTEAWIEVVIQFFKVTEKRKVVYLFLTNRNITIHSESFIFQVKIVSLTKKLPMHCDAELFTTSNMF